MSSITENEKIINHFKSLVEFVQLELKNNSKEKTYLQNYVYFSVAPAFSYTNSILILCKNRKFNAAHVLLRTLFELHINIQYYSFGDVDRKLAIAAKKQFDSRGLLVSELIEIVKKYPNLKSIKKNSLYNPDYLTVMYSQIEKDRENIMSSNSLDKSDKDINLKNKAIECDKQEDILEPGHFENIYHLVYRQLSPYIHLNIEGFESFISEDSNGNIVFEEKNEEELLTKQSIGVCIATIKDLYEIGVIDGDLPKEVELIEELIS